MSLDPYYTPKSIADLLVAAVTVPPTRVGDFAAGGGALLVAATQRWPEADLFAADIDISAVAALDAQFPKADVRSADFLDGAGLQDLRGSLDLVLLNPPFSCRGSSRRLVDLGGEAVRCSLAMAFVCRALSFLSERGELVCILPASCLTSEKDAAARATIQTAYGVDVVQRGLGEAFSGCAVSVAIVRIAAKDSAATGWEPTVPGPVAEHEFTAKLTLGRGACAVGSSLGENPGDAVAFVHTTDIGRHGRNPAVRWAARRPDLGSQPALLVPRVGRPNRSKLVIVEGEQLVLSDCLFWIRGSRDGDEPALQEQLHANWDALASIYCGSCAPYTTLARLTRFLENLGHEVRLALPGAAAPRVPLALATITQSPSPEFEAASAPALLQQSPILNAAGAHGC